MAPAATTSKQSPDSRPPDEARKATLLCPECDHQSPPGGDWVCRSLGDKKIRRCPDCNSVIERRPTFGDRDDDGRQTASSTGALSLLLSRTAAAFQLTLFTPARALALAKTFR